MVGRPSESIVCSHSFWDRCRKMLNLLEPVARVLKMVDGDKKKPTMRYLYESICLIKEAIKTAAPTSHVGLIKIIDDRSTRMLIHPLHLASKLFYFC